MLKKTYDSLTNYVPSVTPEFYIGIKLRSYNLKKFENFQEQNRLFSELLLKNLTLNNVLSTARTPPCLSSCKLRLK